MAGLRLQLWLGLTRAIYRVFVLCDDQICTQGSVAGVLQTVGKERWEGELAQTYFTLVKDLQWKVRRTLSYSFHEVARILGTSPRTLTEAGEEVC
jgi:hypothetical protein